MTKRLFFTIIVLTLNACVSMKVTRAPDIPGKLICIVNQPGVPVDFRNAYGRQIVAKGYKTKFVDAISDCDITSTYTATYGVHWGVYLATATLTINDHGKEIGRADYSAPYASPEKHGRVEGKIEKMVDKLLP